jgi:hypothetical protein
MRYLTITADYLGTGVKDDYAEPIDPQTLNLPQEITDRISRWVAAYQPLISLDENERSLRREEIERLDQDGLNLARDIKTHLREKAKIQYYSEGRLQRLAVC